jgi:hypothetical protein
VHSCTFVSCCRWACCVCMSHLVADSSRLRKHIAGYALSVPQLSCTCCECMPVLAADRGKPRDFLRMERLPQPHPWHSHRCVAAFDLRRISSCTCLCMFVPSAYASVTGAAVVQVLQFLLLVVLSMPVLASCLAGKAGTLTAFIYTT